VLFASRKEPSKKMFMKKILLTTLFSLFFLTGCVLTTHQKYNIEAANINAQLGLAYLKQNQVETSKNKLLLALKQAPYEANVHGAFGYFFAHTGESELAEKHYLYAIKKAREKGSVWHNYGLFLYGQNRYKESLNYFLLAARDINYVFIAKAYANASDTALRLGNNGLAQQYHKKALTHDPRVFDKQEQAYRVNTD
jgi:type IV pilus assembly protein PilF